MPDNYNKCGNLIGDLPYIEKDIKMVGYDEFFDKFKVRITSITSTRLDGDKVERTINFTDDVKSSNDISCVIHHDDNHTFSSYTFGNKFVDELDPLMQVGDGDESIQLYQHENKLKLSIYQGAILQSLLYLKIDFEVTPSVSDIKEDYQTDNTSNQTGENKLNILGNTINESIILIREYTKLPTDKKQEYNDLLRNGFYVHGRAGIFDEINYFDDDSGNEILPTKWYNTQHPFEFEFVVNSPAGLHKIFDNLVIISNNVEPNSLEFELVGDVYDFNKMGIYRSEHLDPAPYWDASGNFMSSRYKEAQFDREFAGNRVISNIFDKERVIVEKDVVLNQYYLNVKQPIKNIRTYGRRLGNIEYKEDRWYTTITPIFYQNKDKNGSKTDIKATRIRDKWVKVRIKYTGTQLVVINAIQTMLRLSYA